MARWLVCHRIDGLETVMPVSLRNNPVCHRIDGLEIDYRRLCDYKAFAIA